MPQQIINIDEVVLGPRPPALMPPPPIAERYEARMGFVSGALGAQKLGYNITAIPPGKRAFPFHNHQMNEEMFFILAGSGEIRIGADTHPVRAGDIIACPPGGPETAHQIINSGTEELRFLAVSTKLSPEVAEYPDTGRFGVLAEMAPDTAGTPRMLMFVGEEGKSLDYWEGL